MTVFYGVHTDISTSLEKRVKEKIYIVITAKIFGMSSTFAVQYQIAIKWHNLLILLVDI